MPRLIERMEKVVEYIKTLEFKNKKLEEEKKELYLWVKRNQDENGNIRR